MEERALKEAVRTYRQIQGQLHDLRLVCREIWGEKDQDDEYTARAKDFCQALYETAKDMEASLDRHQPEVTDIEYHLDLEDRDCWEDPDWPELAGDRYGSGRLTP